MDTFVAELRLEIYRRWVATGRAPAVDELSAAMQQDVVPGLDELAEAHTIVLEPVTKRGRRIHPDNASVFRRADCVPGTQQRNFLLGELCMGLSWNRGASGTRYRGGRSMRGLRGSDRPFGARRPSVR